MSSPLYPYHYEYPRFDLAPPWSDNEIDEQAVKFKNVLLPNKQPCNLRIEYTRHNVYGTRP